jgi:glycosyltransferase involved in cell wall biosynthesis
MKILVAHNAYQQRGGEDAVAEAEVQMLRRHGHEVVEYRRHNDEISGLGRMQLAAQTLWSRRTHAELLALLQQHRPDVLHAHNTFPLISPSLFWAADAAGVPVVQTLHNFRMMCPQGMLLRDGRICEDCVGRSPWPGVVHACYRGSHVQSGVLGSMLMLHRALGTWTGKVQRYIALSDSCRDKFIAAGMDPRRICVKPNFVAWAEAASGARSGFLFAGRLSKEKGLQALAQAATQLGKARLLVAGAGPDAAMLAAVPHVRMLGAVDPAEVRLQMARACAVLVPSIWSETFGMVVIEAFAAGTPVIASRIGALAQLVEDGVTGLHVEPGDAVDLAAKMQWALAHPERMAEMGAKARLSYERLYTEQVNHELLIDIYRQAIAARHAGSARAIQTEGAV